MLLSYISVPELDPSTQAVIRYVRVPMDDVFDVRSRTGSCTRVFAIKGVRFRTEPWLYGASRASLSDATKQRDVDYRLGKLLMDLRRKKYGIISSFCILHLRVSDVADSLSRSYKGITAIIDSIPSVLDGGTSDLVDTINTEAIEAMGVLHERQAEATFAFQNAFRD